MHKLEILEIQQVLGGGISDLETQKLKWRAKANNSTNSSVISFYHKFNVYIFDQVIGAQKAAQFWICYFYTTPLLKYFLTN